MEGWQTVLFGFLGVLVGGLITFCTQRWSVIHENRKRVYEEFIKAFGTIEDFTTLLFSYDDNPKKSEEINEKIDSMKIAIDILHLYASEKVTKSLLGYANLVEKTRKTLAIEIIKIENLQTEKEKNSSIQNLATNWTNTFNKLILTMREDLQK